MDHRERRYRDEIRSIEKQLPLFKQKITELEKRRAELSGLSVNQGPAKPPAEPPDERYSYRYAQLLPPRPGESAEAAVKTEKGTETASAGSPLAFLSRDNVVGVLGEANQKLRTLHQVVNRAAVNMEFILFVINFLSQENPNLQHLMTIAEAVMTQSAEPAAVSGPPADGQTEEQNPAVPSRINLTPETVSEIMKSPLFQQLAAGLTQEKQQE
ncbi:MAG: hypothetical protein HPY50_06850 [Firmicutes bacterium]|nr:hypothetical protein [Bacillota bacterium]